MLDTVDDVIKAVGGNAAAASLAGVGISAVSNWKTRGAIPPENLMTFAEVLAKAGKQADPALFRRVRFVDEARAS